MCRQIISLVSSRQRSFSWQVLNPIVGVLWTRKYYQSIFSALSRRVGALQNIFNIIIITPRVFGNTNYPGSKSLGLPGGLLQTAREEILNHTFFVQRKFLFTGSCQQDTECYQQQKQSNVTSHASWIWDAGYKWVKIPFTKNPVWGLCTLQALD